MKEIEELFNKRLLRKIPINKKKVEKSIEQAKEFLKEAQELEDKIIPRIVIFLSHTWRNKLHSDQSLQ